MPLKYEPFLEWGQNVDKSKVIYKARKLTAICGVTGLYFGEWDLASFKPHGRGIFFADNALTYIQYFQAGNFGDGRNIIINSESHAFSAMNTRTDENGKQND